MNAWASYGMNNASSQSNFGMQTGAQYYMDKKNRAWQEQMYNTRYMRQTQDMKRAGLNPLLSIMGGGTGAGSTPSGSSGSSGRMNSIDFAQLSLMQQQKKLLSNQAKKEAFLTTKAMGEAATASHMASLMAKQNIQASREQIIRDTDWHQKFVLPAKVLMDDVGGSSAKALSNVMSGFKSGSIKRMGPIKGSGVSR